MAYIYIHSYGLYHYGIYSYGILVMGAKNSGGQRHPEIVLYESANALRRVFGADFRHDLQSVWPTSSWYLFFFLLLVVED